MGKKGYAMSAVIYPLLVVCLLLVITILYNVENKRMLLETLKGNVKDSAEYVIPTAPIINGGSNSVVSGSITISVVTDSICTAGIDKYEYYISTSNSTQTGGSWSACTTSEKSQTITTKGTHYVFFRALGNNGKYSAVSNAQTIKIN